MRRTQARQTRLPPPDAFVRLDSLRCEAGCDRPVTIICMGRDERGAVERCYCGPEHARPAGWPWLRSERRAEGRA